MPSNSLCMTCRQLFRLHSAQSISSKRTIPRLLSTGRLLSASQDPPKEPRANPRESQPTPRKYEPRPPPTNSGRKGDPEAPPPEGKTSSAPTTDSPSRSIALEIRRKLPGMTETYAAYGVCDILVQECARQADYTIPQAREKNAEIPKTKDQEDLGVGTGYWFETLGLTPTFNTWAQITFLHMYLLNCRIRCLPPEKAPIWHQHLLDHFFYAAEDRMVLTHNIAARSVRNKYLKDLYVQWRGLLAGYDEGLMKGDAVLATAVWRNIFKADAEVDFRGVGEVVSYIRGVLKELDGLPDERILTGEVVFGDPGSEREGVLLKSRMMIDAAPDVKQPAKAAKA